MRSEIPLKEQDHTELSGLVSSIERLAIHDGPGIRTVVFLKGCPLHCLWCASPQTQSSKPDLLVYPDRCLHCGRCIEICERGAIRDTDGQGKVLDRLRCDLCADCATGCYAEALRVYGEVKTVSQVLAEVERDRVFYEQSGGGVTVSGGEPLQQIAFTRGLLSACRKAGIHTAMETSGFQSWERFRTVLTELDLLLYDLKQMDSQKHAGLTGQSNALILSNLKKALATGVKTIIRVPVIPNHNDDDGNMEAMARFLRQIGPVQRIELLPYHRLGVAMYDRLGREYALPDLEPPSDNKLEHLAGILTREGFRVKRCA
jgi:pyruvate formate lyase activating enzyme